MNRQRGMSLTELLVVLLIIAGLVVLSIPAFFYLREKSTEREMQATLQTLQSRIAAWHYRKLMVSNQDGYPPSLDSNPNQASCARCFEGVMEKGLENERWFKASPTEYRFSGDYRIDYNPQTGSLSVNRLR